MDNLRLIFVWSFGYSLNLWKVIIIFEELEILYEKKIVIMVSVKEELYIFFNLNG